MDRKYISLGMLVFLILLSLKVCAEDEPAQAAKLNFNNDPQEEAIFMRLRRGALSRDSAAANQQARFAIAEYYFKHKAFLDAFRAFKAYSDGFPPETSTLVAKVYLYKIANLKKDTEVAANIKKEIFDNSFILLFTKYKTLLYNSAFNNKYEIHYYVDKIQVFLNGGDFEEIHP